MERMNGPTVAVAAFELRRILRSPGTAVGVLVFVFVLAVGHWVYWSAQPPRAADDRMFGLAYILAMCGMLRFGLAEDRGLALDEFLVVNLVAPARYLAGKLLAVVVFLVVFAAGAFLLSYALGAGDWRFAAWYTVLLTLVAWVFLPAVQLVELLTGTRYPAAFVLVGFTAVILISRWVSSPMAVVEALALDVERYAYDSLVPLAGRGLVSAWLLVMLYPLCRLCLLGRAGWAWGAP